VFYLCVVVKELADSCHPGHYTRMICFGKLFSNQVACRAAARNLFSQVASPPLRHCAIALRRGIPHRGMVGVTGVEPVTLRLSSACSNQLSYTPPNLSRVESRESRVEAAFDSRHSSLDFKLVELRGFEPLTYSLQSCRSTN
jgi:hypothetical protein